MSHYRSDEEGLQRQLAQQQERIQQELTITRAMRGLHQRRVARSVAGQVGALCGVMLFVSAFLIDDGESLSIIKDHDFHDLDNFPARYQGLSASMWFLLLAPLLSLLAYVISYFFSLLAFHLQQRSPALHQDLRWDLDRLSVWNPAMNAKRSIESLSFRSFVWPLTALSLLMPLSLHFIVALVADGWSTSASFHGWIKTSAEMVGQCHLALALLCWVYARQLHRGVPSNQRLKGLGISFWTSASAIFPVGALTMPSSFFLAGFILSVFVFFTGLVFIPLMIKWAEIQHKKESATLEAIGQ
jgi:hypothetical protein